MKSIFPQPIVQLPKAAIPINGVIGHLSQSDTHQIVFMEFSHDVTIPEHAHESQWELVLEGKVDLVLEGEYKTYHKGDHFFIPKGARHGAHVYAGYASIAFFNEKERYSKK